MLFWLQITGFVRWVFSKKAVYTTYKPKNDRTIMGFNIHASDAIEASVVVKARVPKHPKHDLRSFSALFLG